MEIPELKNHGFAVLFPKLLSNEECDKLIEQANEKEWQDALILCDGHYILDTETRFCKRVMYVDETVADNILDKIKIKVPQEFANRSFADINPMLRFLKYNAGNYFRNHYDLCYQNKLGHVSLITVQIYLNDDFTGGETAFYNDNEKLIYSHKPQKGDIILFEQSFEHCGREVTEGVKYSLRTELMYC